VKVEFIALHNVSANVYVSAIHITHVHA